jgi:hypothetical protein
MGYESRIYVVEKFDTIDDESNKRYARVIASVEMCKAYGLSDELRNCPETDCYFYELGGDDPVIEDCYGKPLTEATISQTIKFLIGAMAHDDYDYWRYNVLLGTLKSFEKYEHPNLVVLHYGH